MGKGGMLMFMCWRGFSGPIQATLSSKKSGITVDFSSNRKHPFLPFPLLFPFHPHLPFQSDGRVV